jgi:preprotein translocase subunit SecD
MHALPMYLGLDLRGGVHFLLQVDMKGALTKRLDATAGDLRTLLRDKQRAPRRHRPRGRPVSPSASATPRCATRRAPPSSPSTDLP